MIAHRENSTIFVFLYERKVVLSPDLFELKVQIHYIFSAFCKRAFGFARGFARTCKHELLLGIKSRSILFSSSICQYLAGFWQVH